jgi:hypothetical protein
MMARKWTAGLLLLPLAAHADGFDYSYVEGGFVSSEINTGPFDADGDGVQLVGSFAIKDEFHLFAGYADQSYDFGIDSTTLSFGAGVNYGLHADWDLIGRLSYVTTEVDTPFGSADEDGFGVTGGVRGRLARKVELDAGLNYVDVGDSDTSLFVSTRYFLNDHLALGGGLGLNDGDTTLNVTVRAQFGRQSSASVARNQR